MKKSWFPWPLVFGLFLGMLLTVPWVDSAPIQQQVGINGFDTDISPNRWTSIESNTADQDNDGTGNQVGMLTTALPHVFNGTGWDRTRGNTSGAFSQGPVAAGSAVGGNPVQIAVSDGTNVQRVRQVITTVGFTLPAGFLGVIPCGIDQTVPDLATCQRSGAGSGDGATGAAFGTQAIHTFNGTTWDRVRSVDATTLSETTSAGTALTAPLSTWSVTNTPATATQATASRAAGGAGVRHVATSVTVCIATGATAQTPILAHLRDGATGAGTIIRSWSHAAPVNSRSCNDISGLAMIGTAATAMTVEFTGAGVAASQQTVTLTGFSVQ